MGNGIGTEAETAAHAHPGTWWRGIGRAGFSAGVVAGGPVFVVAVMGTIQNTHSGYVPYGILDGP